VSYCIDTSCLIAAWEERYPPENFPKFWNYLDQLILDGRVRAPAAVLDETEKKSKELHAWLKDRPSLFIDYEEEIQLEVRNILANYPRLVMEKKQRFAADSFIIATAKAHGLTIVTEEKPTGSLNRPNIPDVCRDMHLEWIGLIQLIRAEAWVIS
jgi:predicted nucleic acid-binding protein